MGYFFDNPVTQTPEQRVQAALAELERSWRVCCAEREHVAQRIDRQARGAGQVLTRAQVRSMTSAQIGKEARAAQALDDYKWARDEAKLWMDVIKLRREV